MRAINRNYYLLLLGLNDKYQWVEDPKSFYDAREFCQSLGDGWDMAIIISASKAHVCFEARLYCPASLKDPRRTLNHLFTIDMPHIAVWLKI